MKSPAEREPRVLYRNAGNPAVLAHVPAAPCRILDVGCGAGDNARILREKGHQVWGITLSPQEAALARSHAVEVWVGDVNSITLPVHTGFFDVLLMSHVLEHFAQPALALTRLSHYLRAAGLLIAAVPNMAHWRVRLRILRGDWRRDDTGPFDRTHLQFWSVATAESILLETPFEPVYLHGASPSAPLRPVRKISQNLARAIDTTLGELAPNLIAQQIVFTAKRRPAP